MSVSQKNIIFQQDEIVYVTRKGEIFAATIVGNWVGRGLFYTVQNCLTGIEHFVPAAQVAPFKVKARADDGKDYTVRLTRFQDNGRDFFCRWRGTEYTLTRAQVTQVIEPRFALPQVAVAS